MGHTLSEPLVERMRGFGTTIFAEMTALAQQTGAVNLGQGFPDTDGPNAMLEQAVEAIRGGLNQYPPGPGLPPLRQAIAAHRKARYGLAYDPDTEVLVTVGATEGITASILALCEAGDEVVLLEPYYDSYAAAIALAGAVRRPVPLRPASPGGRFTFDPDDLRKAVSERTRLLLINSPHNPTGTTLTVEELQIIADVAIDHDLVVLTDEVYEHLTFDDVRHVPIATLPGMRERTVSVSSAGKTFSVTGWKVGWVCAPAALTRAVMTVKQFTTFTHSGAMQLAVAHGLLREMEWVEALRSSLQLRRDRLGAGLATVGLTVHVPEATYFIIGDVRPLGLDDGEAFARALPHEGGVVGIPVGVFCDDAEVGKPFVRFAFCKRDDVLDEAVDRLVNYAGRRHR
ncbi:MAG TPA: pyridoxal phosphate-dependent aminotransferase [Mycobacteriales bacterium]|nr:pyridoxal phosphate-dependent aminotransferase [Mycobacteriales bacterium]